MSDGFRIMGREKEGDAYRVTMSKIMARKDYLQYKNKPTERDRIEYEVLKEIIEGFRRELWDE